MVGGAGTQGRAERPHEDATEEQAATPASPQAPADRELLDDVDGLLDEIDAVLETNAEEFVRGYVQKGGQ